MYTTIEAVRKYTNFLTASKISDVTVRDEIMRATARVNSVAGRVYILPLPYRKQSSVTFSGTGTGTGTLAIVVNGVTYNVPISNGATASQCADRFRQAVSSSTSGDFHTDDVGCGAIVLVYSSDYVDYTASASDVTAMTNQVTITSAPTTQGISVSQGNIIDRQHPEIEAITREIASAYLLQTAYGIEAQDTPKDGYAKAVLAENRLKSFFDPTPTTTNENARINLYDEVTGEEYPRVLGSGVSFYPTQESTDDGETESVITMSKTW